jgi:hypothetical protein
MPRGVVVRAGLLLLILAGIATAVGLLGPAERNRPPQLMVAGGDPTRGERVIRRSGCTACHVIPALLERTGWSACLSTTSRGGPMSAACYRTDPRTLWRGF